MTPKVRPGAVFGRLTVLRLIANGPNPLAECRCECGAITTPQRGALRNGRTKSCGCLRREQNITAGIKHGLCGTPEALVFNGMMARCNNPNSPGYRHYGGRGIRVLYRDVVEFVEDVGPRPAEGMEIDRIDTNGHYAPGNCRWATPTENMKNTRRSKVWIIDGVEYDSSVEAARALGVKPPVIVQGCNGCMRGGRFKPPRPGWSSRLKYAEDPCA